MFNRQQTKAIEAYRAAEQHLAHTRETSSQAQHAALNGIQHDRDRHPGSDTKARLEAEAEIRLAEAAAEVDRTCADSNGLRASLADVIRDYSAKRAAIVDPPTPTLQDTPEAASEFERASAAHAEALKAAASERRRLKYDLLRSFPWRAADDGSDILERASAALDSCRANLAEVEDPEPPVLGDATVPAVVMALPRALAAHRAILAENQRKREELYSDFRGAVDAINEGFRQLSKRRRDAGLPSPSLFAREPAIVVGYTNSVDRLLADSAMLDNALKALGPTPVNCDGARRTLRECDARRRAWEDREATKAKAQAKTNGGLFAESAK